MICGDTEITAANIRIIINQQNRPTENGNTGFQNQFQVLIYIQKREGERKERGRD